MKNVLRDITGQHFLVSVVHSECQWTDGGGERTGGEGETGTETKIVLLGRVHSTAAPANNTASHVCTVVHSAERKKLRGQGEGETEKRGCQVTLAQLQCSA